MKTKKYSYTDKEGNVLLTNGKRVSFSHGHKLAISFNNEDKSLWERVTGRKLTAVLEGEEETLDVHF